MHANNVIMFCGKGGVGKTTCAAATALHYSLAGRRTLVISTDFTPSLRHIFDVQSHDKPVPVGENLYIDEISYDDVKLLWDRKFGPEVYEVFSSFVSISYEDFVDFIVSILPGLKDEFMVDYIRELSESGDFDMVVWDTAPAGQTMGLLHMPTMLNEHLKPAPRIYSSLRLVRQRKRSVLGIIKEWQALSEKDIAFLRNGVDFNLVTIPEALAVRQLDGLFNEFRAYDLHIRHIVINQVIQTPDSPFLASKARMQEQYLHDIEANYGVGSTRLPLFPYEIVGRERLLEVERSLYRDGRQP